MRRGKTDCVNYRQKRYFFKAQVKLLKMKTTLAAMQITPEKWTVYSTEQKKKKKRLVNHWHRIDTPGKKLNYREKYFGKGIKSSIMCCGTSSTGMMRVCWSLWSRRDGGVGSWKNIWRNMGPKRSKIRETMTPQIQAAPQTPSRTNTKETPQHTPAPPWRAAGKSHHQSSQREKPRSTQRKKHSDVSRSLLGHHQTGDPAANSLEWKSNNKTTASEEPLSTWNSSQWKRFSKKKDKSKVLIPKLILTVGHQQSLWTWTHQGERSPGWKWDSTQTWKALHGLTLWRNIGTLCCFTVWKRYQRV